MRLDLNRTSKFLKSMRSDALHFVDSPSFSLSTHSLVPLNKVDIVNLSRSKSNKENCHQKRFHDSA